MNKKLIVLIIAVVALVAIIGVVYLINNNSLNKENSSKNNSKALGTTIQTEENEPTSLNENKQNIRKR